MYLTERNGQAVDEQSDHTYNEIGSRQSLQYANGNYTYYGYDALNRLTLLTNSEQFEADPQAPTGSTLSKFEYDLYADGMRQKAVEEILPKGGIPGTTPLKSQTVAYTYDNLNRLILEDADDDGSITVTEYKYDSEGNRVAKIVDGVTTTYLIDPYNHTGYTQVLEETTGTDITSYVIGDDVLAQATNSAAPQYLLYDGHGSTRQLSDSTGVLVPDESYSYDAYGVMLGGNPQAPAGTSLLYSGEWYDSESQNYYLRARYYDSFTGRFNRIDPYSGDTDDPQSLHKYLYCHNDPLNNLDPSGQFSIAEVVSVQSISKMVRQLHLGQVYMVYDRVDTTLTAINLFNQWRASGRVDLLSLSILAAAILPIGKIMKNVKIGANKLVGASDDLTKLFRSAGKRTNKIVQSIGELGAEITARAKRLAPTRYIPSYHGFDQIYRKGGRFVIVEAKGGTGRLAKGQMSKQWIRKNIKKLKYCGDPINEALAKELEQAFAEGAVDAMVVTTKIIGNEVQDPEFMFKTFQEIGKAAF